MRVVPATASFYTARGIGRRRARLWTKSCVGRERLVTGTERAVSKRQNLQALGEAFPLLYMIVINWFGIEMVFLQFVSQDKEFVICHFHNYCLVQIVSL